MPRGLLRHGRLARLRRDEGGFGVVEVLVALSLMGVVAAAVLPVLVLSGSAATVGRDRTQAKNLAAERMEVLRSLSFHVARQNQPAGAPTDLLDLHYPRAVATAGPLATTTTFVAPGTTGRPSGEPSTGAYYRTHTAALPSAPRYSQTVTVQFLQLPAGGGQGTPVTPATSYDATLVGQDAPPTRLAEVRVLIGWTYGGKAMSTVLTSQIADTGNGRTPPGGAAPGGTSGQALVSQAKATALSVLSTATNDEISLRVGTAVADGAAGTSSTAAVEARAANVGVTGGTDVNGALSSVSSPPDGTVAAKTGPAWTYNSGCDVGCFGPSRTSALAASVLDGLPLAGGSPSPSSSSPAVAAVPRRASCTSTPCLRTTKPVAFSGYLFSDSSLLLDYSSSSGGKTHGAVTLEDPAAGDAAVGTAHVGATSGTARSVTAGATAAVPTVLGILPTSQTLAAGAGGLVRITLDSASLSCQAGVSGATATAAFKGTLWYWGKLANGTFGYTAVPFERTAAGGWSASALPSFSSVVVAEITTGSNKGTWYLSQYLDSITFGSAPTVATSPGSVRANLTAVSVVTRGLTDPSYGVSTYSVEVGQLSCQATDAR